MRTTLLSITMSLTLATTAFAGISQSTITAPGGFMQAGSYDATCGCGNIPGSDMVAAYGTGMDFHELAFSGVGPVTQSAAGSIGTINNHASGTTGMGAIRFSTYNASPATAHFASGIANGGWKETFTVSHPSLDGQAGFMVFQLRYRGTINVTGPGAIANILTTGYKNNAELIVNPYFNRGASDPIGTDRQRVQWGLASAPEASRTIDGVATMAVPITFGQSFSLGIYGRAASGQRSSGANPAISTGTVNFTGDGITWNGIVDVKTAAGASVSGYTITSGTGLDWTTPFAQCDADLSGDGLVDFADYLEFLNLFDAMDPAADFNGDGLVDFADYLEFLNLYEAGC